MTELHSTRRHLLTIASITGGTFLAGCTDSNTQTRPNTDDEIDELNTAADHQTTDNTPTEERAFSPEDGVLTQVGPTQQELQEIQEQILAQSEQDGWSESRVREEYQSIVEEQVNEEISAFSEWAESTNGIEVIDTIPQAGILLLDGDDSALMNALRSQTINTLLPGADFERVEQTVANSTSSEPDSEPDPNNEPIIEPN